MSALRIFYSHKAHCFWLGITCHILATRDQRLPGVAAAQTLDPQILSLMPWLSLFHRKRCLTASQVGQLIVSIRSVCLLGRLTWDVEGQQQQTQPSWLGETNHVLFS